MEQIRIKTHCKKMLADLNTPVSIYLRIRDQFPGSVMLESADSNAGKNSFSYIAIKPIAGMEINKNRLEYKYPGNKEIDEPIGNQDKAPEKLMNFIRHFTSEGNSPVSVSESFFGYTAYESIRFFETLDLDKEENEQPEIPLLRYRLYQYVIAIDHFKNELYLCENQVEEEDSEFEQIETLILQKDCPTYPFETVGDEKSNMTDEDYRQIVQKCIAHCHRGDVFQIVPSRSFKQEFKGDEFNVYRTLRSINPSPYLFYFDYGNYKIMGSSPESQLIVEGNKAVIHPIAGTVKRTGNEEEDKAAVEQLVNDEKENAEHVMLVDLARNDMSRFANNVHVSEYRQVHSYSHVIHLVSEVTGEIPEGANPFKLLAASFPAGTLSGAPKYKAMELIRDYEVSKRGFYAGCVGSVGLNGDFNHAIMIRSFLSKDNNLRYQAGAGVVSRSVPENELQEVNNKLNALKQAIVQANKLNK